jgi:hypothetical protein
VIVDFRFEIYTLVAVLKSQISIHNSQIKKADLRFLIVDFRIEILMLW